MKESNYVHFFYRLDSSLSFWSGEREVYSGFPMNKAQRIWGFFHSSEWASFFAPSNNISLSYGSFSYYIDPFFLSEFHALLLILKYFEPFSDQILNSKK